MAVRKKLMLSFMAASFMASQHAMASDITSQVDLKNLVVKALKDGSSEGDLTGAPEASFQRQTHSDHPVKIRITKIKSYSHGCGRIHVEMRQDGIIDANGKAQTVAPWYEVNICPDGDPPVEEVAKMKRKFQFEITSCRVGIHKFLIDKSGAQDGEIVAFGCPKNGISLWRYDGNCGELKMPSEQVAKTPISPTGEIHIKLKIPRQCLSKTNVWTGVIVDVDPIGTIQAHW